MGRNSVISDEEIPTTKELMNLGKDKLLELQNKAANRLWNLYEHGYTNEQEFRVWSLKQDIKSIEEALRIIDKKEGTSYYYRVESDSREDIAEKYCIAKRESMIYRNDEGVDFEKRRRALEELGDLQNKMSELKALGFPLSQEELNAAESRLRDRTVRMKFGARRRDFRMICSRCRASIYTDSIYCSNCGNVVGKKPTAKAFICYAHMEKSWVEELSFRLKKLNINVWFDQWELLPGDSLIDSINRAIPEYNVFLYVASKNSINRPWPQEELKAALNLKFQIQNFKIIPLLIDDCSDRIPPLLKDTVYMKFFDDSGIPIDLSKNTGNQLLMKLKTAIEGTLPMPNALTD